MCRIGTVGSNLHKRVYCSAGRHIRDYQTVAVSYVILMIYVYMTAGKMKRVKSPILLTFAVVVSVFASLIIAYGGL